MRRTQMRIRVAATPEEFARWSADIVCAAAQRQPAATIGLPSGRTPLAMYDELARRVQDGAADLSGVTVFAIDELHGIAPSHPATNAHYFREHLTERVPLRAFHVMSSEPERPDLECERFRRLIAEAGGLDLVVLGIGANGHIGFNEPGSPFDSTARRVTLAPATREAYSHHFGSMEHTPAFGLTLGIADLLAAREALLLASGGEKATVIAEALEGPMTESLPASALQRHPALTVVLDRQAASRLSGAVEPS